MKKLLFIIILITPLFVYAQERELYVKGVNIKDIDTQYIEITHYDTASLIDVYVDFGQCKKRADYPKCTLLTDKEGKPVRFSSTPKVLGLFPDYELKWIDKSQNDIYLQRKD